MYGEAPKELYLSKEQKVKKMSEIVPNGYTKIDYQKKADWQMDKVSKFTVADGFVNLSFFTLKKKIVLKQHSCNYISPHQ